MVVIKLCTDLTGSNFEGRDDDELARGCGLARNPYSVEMLWM